MKNRLLVFFVIFFCLSSAVLGQIPTKTLVDIVKAEDERRWDTTLEKLLESPNIEIRRRTALAIGRIGNENAVPALVRHLNDSPKVTEMILFALGEIESPKASQEIISFLKKENQSADLIARAVEAAGKISAANPKDALTPELNKTFIETIDFEDKKRSAPYEKIILAGLTAILRARPEGGEKTAAEFLRYSASIRAAVFNTLARLRSKTVNDQARDSLEFDKDPIVRANAARMLGVGEDKTALNLLLKAATTDTDSRVRVSAIRALGSLKDAGVTDKLIEYGEKLLSEFKKSQNVNSAEKSEIAEVITTLGRLLPNTKNPNAINFFLDLNSANLSRLPEAEIALARIAPEYSQDSLVTVFDEFLTGNWQEISAVFQGVAELANLESNKENDALKSQTRVLLVRLISEWVSASVKNKTAGKTKLAIPDLLTTFAAFKSENNSGIFRSLLEVEPDIQIRATIAGILADQPVSNENIEALDKAFNIAFLNDKDSNDAQLAIMDAVFKLDKKKSIPTLFVAAASKDYLVRKKAFELLKDESFKDSDLVKITLEKFTAGKKNQVLPYSYGSKLGQLLNTNADYIRAVSRKNGTIKAILTTTKGNFTIDFSPEDAPLTIDNFVKLAKSNYFNGVSVHRVVPNFVMQDGDPRGDGNGGPGWEIRCEINMLPFERGAVGMALSGKDTGGSQWFVTHSPQPHLDGGYTVFGNVNETDMKIVDSIVRGDKIISVKIVEEISTPKVRNSRKTNK